MTRRDDQAHKPIRNVLLLSKSEELERRIQQLESKLAALQAQLDHVLAKKQQFH